MASSVKGIFAETYWGISAVSARPATAAASARSFWMTLASWMTRKSLIFLFYSATKYLPTYVAILYLRELSCISPFSASRGCDELWTSVERACRRSAFLSSNCFMRLQKKSSIAPEAFSASWRIFFCNGSDSFLQQRWHVLSLIDTSSVSSISSALVKSARCWFAADFRLCIPWPLWASALTHVAQMGTLHGAQ